MTSLLFAPLTSVSISLTYRASQCLSQRLLHALVVVFGDIVLLQTAS